MALPAEALILETRIQHAPSRRELLDDLLPRLDGLDPLVVTDPGGRSRSSWRSHRACLESVGDEATHLLCVQDDDRPCQDFAALALAAVAERPHRIICLFVSGIGPIMRQVNVARTRGERWMEFPSLSYLPTVAIVYPAEIARQIPGYADAKRIPVSRADDAVVGTFARAHRLSACAPLPSLVEHRDEVPSAMLMPSGAGRPHRRAAWFVESPAP